MRRRSFGARRASEGMREREDTRKPPNGEFQESCRLENQACFALESAGCFLEPSFLFSHAPARCEQSGPTLTQDQGPPPGAPIPQGLVR